MIFMWRMFLPWPWRRWAGSGRDAEWKKPMLMWAVKAAT